MDRQLSVVLLEALIKTLHSTQHLVVLDLKLTLHLGLDQLLEDQKLEAAQALQAYQSLKGEEKRNFVMKWKKDKAQSEETKI